MGAKPNARRVRAFFLIDRVGGEEGKYLVFEGLLDRLLGQIVHDSTIKFSVRSGVIAMGAATCQRIQIVRSASGRFKLSPKPVGCDLGGALRLLESSLRGEDSKDRVEVFVFLHSEPAGDWQAGIETLKAHRQVRLHFYPFMGEAGVQPDTVEEIKTRWADGLIKLQQFTSRNMEWVFRHDIFLALKEAVEMVDTPSPSAVSAQTPQPVQPVTAHQEKAPRSPEVSAGQREGTSDPPGRPLSLQPLPGSSKVSAVAHDTASTVEGEEEQDKGKGKEPGQAETGRLPKSEFSANGAADVMQHSAEMQAEKETEETRADQVLPEEVTLETPGEPATGSGDEVVQDVADQVPPEETAAETPGEPASGLGDEMVREDVTPAAKAEPPPVDEEGVATIWKEEEPSPELDDRVPHEDKKVLDAPDDWQMIGASRRGKMHAHKGIFREDAFALGEAAGWHLMVVADGGGSCPLSRVGSQLAADIAVETMARLVKSMANAVLPAAEVCEIALRKGLEEAWKALQAKADKRQVPLKHLGTTFLSVIHRPCEQGSILGVVQVGDGLVAAELADGKIVALAEPDVGETASVTLFLTSKHWKEWVDRVNVQTLEASPLLLAAMCDGIADDFIPFERHLRKLFDALNQVIEQEQPQEALLQLLGYDKRGSFDDRTLALIYQPQVRPSQELEQETKPEGKTQAEEEPVEKRIEAAELAPTPSVEVESEAMLGVETRTGEEPVRGKPEAVELILTPPPVIGGSSALTTSDTTEEARAGQVEASNLSSGFPPTANTPPTSTIPGVTEEGSEQGSDVA